MQIWAGKKQKNFAATFYTPYVHFHFQDKWASVVKIMLKCLKKAIQSKKEKIDFF